ncbi:granzyme B-like isoform X2 [Oreochromis niloticus]|uniref:granzyme B-like n=1 Tax=Oreochromis aureus TaxID=47969 RepID=UPI00090468C8|nr:granzyme B-like isoform X2 [Oreochromis niloticus]XP_039468822.1 granzyme B-like [Oreochromis aureus]
MFALQQFAVIHALTFLGQNVLGSKIINGKIAPDNKMLYMASVQDYRGYHICGGFLVSENFVMTAAHCDLYPTYVVLGNHHLRSADKLVIQIAEKYKHPYYWVVGHGYDIMLLKLSTPVRPSKRIQFIRLPFREMTLNENEKCRVAGWGKINTSGNVVDDLRVVGVSVISPQVCRERWGGLPPNVICAGGYNTTKGFCQGDSGGPLVCKGMAVGIVSFNKRLPGTKLGNCNYPDVPNVYTDISKHLDWIRMILQGKKS